MPSRRLKHQQKKIPSHVLPLAQTIQLSLVGHMAGYLTMLSRLFHHVLEFG